MNDIDTAARDILRRNDRGGYTVPSAGLYPFQWNWDSATVAAAFASFDVARGWRELETLLAGQWRNGMVPHILFHAPAESYFPGPEVWRGTGPAPSSGITQPPLAATMARRLFNADRELGAARLASLFERLDAWHRWFVRERSDAGGAICVTHPWESGRDNAPDWDDALKAVVPGDLGDYERRDLQHVGAAMRPTKYDYDRYLRLARRGAEMRWNEDEMRRDPPFRVADPATTFILLRAQRDLAALGRELGRDTGHIEDSVRVLEAGAETLWNSELGAFDARDVLSGRRANSLSAASFLCWYAGMDRPEMRTRLRETMDAARFALPSLSPRDARFDSLRYWRGPVWPVMNMLAGLGLREAGLGEGETLRETTAALVADGGFAEYYDAASGAPAGGGNFSWTAAVWLAWASPDAEDELWAR